MVEFSLIYDLQLMSDLIFCHFTKLLHFVYFSVNAAHGFLCAFSKNILSELDLTSHCLVVKRLEL